MSEDRSIGYLVTALLAFSIMFAIGVFVGREQMREESAFALWLGQRLELLRLEDGRHVLRYQADEDWYAYDVDSQQLHFSDSVIEASHGPESRPTQLSAFSEADFLKLLGGGVAAWNIKDFLRASEHSKGRGRAIVAILGGVVGYGFGHRVGIWSMRHGDEARALTVKILTNAKMWPALSQIIYKDAWSSLLDATEDLKSEVDRERLQSRLFALGAIGGDEAIRSERFITLEEIRSEVITLPTRSEPLSTFEWIMLIVGWCALTALGVAMACFSEHIDWLRALAGLAALTVGVSIAMRGEQLIVVGTSIGIVSVVYTTKQVHGLVKRVRDNPPKVRSEGSGDLG